MEEEILNRRWKDVDKLLLKYNKDYKKLNRKTQDRLQDVFNLINVSYQDINKPISKQEKARLDRFIQEMQKDGLLNNYFGYKARLILNKKKVTYSKMLEIMIEGCYVKENKELDEINNLLYYEIADSSYRQGIKEANIPKPIYLHIPFETMYLLLNVPLLNATADAYIEAIELKYAEETYKRSLMALQRNDSIDVNSREFQELFKKQQRGIINIKEEGQPTGAMSNITDNLVNEAYLQAAKDNEIKKARFIAIMDSKTTKMCRSMNNMVFNVSGRNKFKRYSDEYGALIDYDIYGLVQGINLPPIDDHFHYCRSTITYMWDNEDVPDRLEHKELRKVLNSRIPKSFDEFIKLKYNNDEWYESTLREKVTINTIKTNKDYTNDYKHKLIKTYYDFRKRDIEMTTHALNRFLGQKKSKERFSENNVVYVLNKKANYYEPNTTKDIKFYDGLAIVQDRNNKEVITIYTRGSIKGEWEKYE